MATAAPSSTTGYSPKLQAPWSAAVTDERKPLKSSRRIPECRLLRSTSAGVRRPSDSASTATFEAPLFPIDEEQGRLPPAGVLPRLPSCSPPSASTARLRNGVEGDRDDRDGWLDLIVVNDLDGRAQLLRNEVDGGHWLSVELHGRGKNAGAIGALILLRAGGQTQRRLVQSGTGYLSQNDLSQHFGLGSATRVDAIEVRWPDGTVSKQNGGGNRSARGDRAAPLVVVPDGCDMPIGGEVLGPVAQVRSVRRLRLPIDLLITIRR